MLSTWCKEMKTSSQIIQEQSKIIQEVEQFFKIQDAYFNDRIESNLDKLRIQQKKVKQMISDSKKPIPTLR